MTASRTYLFALVDGGGTVPPELAVVRRLVDRGHDITVLAEDTMEAEVTATGATFRRWEQAPNRTSRRPEHDPFRDWECKSPMKLMERLHDNALSTPAPAFAADVDAAVAQRRPDLVVCSQFAVGAMVGAESAGIPFSILMPNIYLLPADGLPPFGMGLRPAKGRLGRTRDRIVNAMTRRMWDKGLDRINALRTARGLDPLAHFCDQMLRAHRQLMLTSPEFDFPGRVPGNARYVGPQLDDPAWTDAWQLPADDREFVLVALSSTFQDQIDCLDRVAAALGTLPVRALLTTGPAVDPDAVTAPANVDVVRSAPHSQALAHAAAVVTHGGHGTVAKSLAAGVPMVVMPHGRDQADNATRVVTRDAGVMVKRSAKPEAIAAAVRSVLGEPKFRRGAERLGEIIRRDAAGTSVVDELEDIPDAASTGARALAG